MSKGDKLLEELGYKKYDNHPEEKEEINKWTTQDCRVIEYTQQETIEGMVYTLFIRFHIEGKVVEIGANERREEYEDYSDWIEEVYESYDENIGAYRLEEHELIKEREEK